jgi:hypothetical protein
MRLFGLLNFQHLMLYLFPTLVFMVVFGAALAFARFRGEHDERRLHDITYRFAEEIEDRDAPFPLAMILIIAGTVIWAVGYILITGMLGVVI